MTNESFCQLPSKAFALELVLIAGCFFQTFNKVLDELAGKDIAASNLLGEVAFECEFNHTVELEDFPKIAERFGLDPATPILENIKQISTSGRGQEFKDLLTIRKIPSKFWSWLS